MTIFLGLDLGTTKSAAVLVDGDGRNLLAASSLNHNAGLAQPGTQAVAEHLATVRRLLAALPEDLKSQVAGIGVTGQMHGVTVWNERAISPLYTWQSAVPNLAELQARPGCAGLRNGFGGATLGWLAATGQLGDYTHSATIHDYLVWHLTGASGRPVTDPTDAASWGIFDMRRGEFDAAAVAALGIPPELLPQVVACGAAAGRLSAEWAQATGLPVGIPVGAALGDNQASVLATARNPEDEIYLTLGTGAQLSVVVTAAEARRPVSASFELRPFPGGRFLAVAAPLCGGQAWALLHGLVKGWMQELGAPSRSDAELYDRLDALALAALRDTDLPVVAPHFLGERYDADLRGTIGGLNLSNVTPGKLAAGWALGIVQNLYDALPEELLAGRGHLLVSGNAMRKTAALRQAAAQIFGVEPELAEGREEAACGAALLVASRGE